MSSPAEAGLAGLLPSGTLEEGNGRMVAGRRVGVVVRPGSVAEVAAVLRRASAHGWSVLPAGAGSWLGVELPVGGAAAEIGVLLSTERLADVERYEPADLTLTAGAGLRFDTLRERTATEGQWLPVDPPGYASGTLGGLVATAAPGPLEAGFGRVRDLVLGATLVTGDGRVLELGGRVVKNVAGFDLLKLAVGSRGSLGVVTSATVRLFPRPPVDRTLVVPGPSIHALLPAARAVAGAPVPLAALELVEDPPPAPDSDGEARLLVRMLGSRPVVEETTAAVLDRLSDPAHEAVEDEASEGLHAGLARLPEEPGLLLRARGLPSDLSRTLEAVGRAASEADARLRRAAHVTEGTVRAVGPVGADGAALAAALRGLRDRLEAVGGSLVVLRLPERPALPAPFPPRASSDDLAGLLKGIRRAFDPAGVLVGGRERA